MLQQLLFVRNVDLIKVGTSVGLVVDDDDDGAGSLIDNVTSWLSVELFSNA